MDFNLTFFTAKNEPRKYFLPKRDSLYFKRLIEAYQTNTGLTVQIKSLAHWILRAHRSYKNVIGYTFKEPIHFLSAKISHVKYGNMAHLK